MSGPEHAKPSKPQKALLDEIRTTVNDWGQPGLYVRRYGQYGRTVQGLVRRGLVVCDERDSSGQGIDHYVATPAAPLEPGDER